MKTREYFLFDRNDTSKKRKCSIIMPTTTKVPDMYIQAYRGYCGPGNGIGERLVPDTIWGVNVSPACFVHDLMWARTEATWEAFHFSNSVFLRNLISLVNFQSKSKIMRCLRLYRCITYYAAVDMAGAGIFWEIKKQ